MPRLATVADKYSVIRNMSFTEYLDGHNPFGSVVSRLRGDAVRDMPPYVAFDGFDSKPGRGTDSLGVAHRPFVPSKKMTGLAPVAGVTHERLALLTMKARRVSHVGRPSRHFVRP